MKARHQRKPCNCSHGCFNGEFCIHRDVFRNARKNTNGGEAEMIKFPLELNYPFPNMPRMFRKQLGIRRVGERLV